ncbi:LytTR family DNA-binding domain-containing protein [Flavobacterium sp.]|uniref:LytR/AlgR family response regulator transcription factor n=1 Tax=Flavobacterium sp. TaxID=239 RepID=UPI002B4B8F08|nr:LytTR family DNA-binding domain-containing protein [Flavobacterium sp.]HLP64966.1 LytTR family DNA-binding domain-containing protein [Flavobacterium sp.]
MRTLIIEDEAQAISALKSELNYHCPQIEIVGEAKSVKEAIEIIKQLQPELIFLDIQLSDGLGFDILTAYKEHTFKIIFTTAYSQYAIKAIKFSALDYLLKPIDSEELKDAVAKAQEHPKDNDLAKIETLISNFKLKSDRKKIALQTSEGISVYEIDTILRCSAESNYTCVYFVNGKKSLFSKTLKEFEELLENSGFERIHHSHIINLNHLVNFINKDGGYVVMSDKSTLPVSQRKKTNLINALNNLT